MNQSWCTRWCVNHNGYKPFFLPNQHINADLILLQTPSISSDQLHSINSQDLNTQSKRLLKGFSLFEVLVSLLLLTSISLAVLKQQWKSNPFFASFIYHIDYLLETDNQCENQQPTP